MKKTDNRVSGNRNFWLANVLLAASLLQTATADTLENMERERAILVDTLLSAEITNSERVENTLMSQRRLVDLERMVIRDQQLQGRNTPLVRTAFENYDLTFLLHASREKNRLIIDHWLEQVGITTHTLMNSRAGRR